MQYTVCPLFSSAKIGAFFVKLTNCLDNLSHFNTSANDLKAICV
jgi:hypothetical protein